MKVGDTVKVIEESSRFLGMTGKILTTDPKGNLLFVVFDDKTVTNYSGLYFLSYELETTKC